MEGAAHSVQRNISGAWAHRFQLKIRKKGKHSLAACLDFLKRTADV